MGWIDVADLFKLFSPFFISPVSRTILISRFTYLAGMVESKRFILQYINQHRPWQIGVGRLVSRKIAYFPGQTVNLPEGSP
jgi:hypothetical protein